MITASGQDSDHVSPNSWMLICLSLCFGDSIRIETNNIGKNWDLIHRASVGNNGQLQPIPKVQPTKSKCKFIPSEMHMIYNDI